MVASTKYQDKYVDYLLLDLERNIKKNPSTIYIGGGTPSSLSLDNLNRLFNKIKNLVNLENILEYTIEVNPEDINLDLIECLKTSNVSRISLGIQTFNPRLQKVINRYCDFDDIKQKIDLLKKHGFHNINVDLMYGIGDETLVEVLEDLNKMLLLRPTHISTYSLILEEKTILYYQYQKGLFKLCDPDLESTMYYEIVKVLKNQGFNHYEISNFALPNHESLHNLIYWNNEEYFGIGAGSSGYYEGLRYKVNPKIEDYYHALEYNGSLYVDEELIDDDTKMWEELMLGLRKIEGVSIIDFRKKYKKEIFMVFPNINLLTKQGFLEVKNNYLRITDNNYYISNSILTKLM